MVEIFKLQIVAVCLLKESVEFSCKFYTYSLWNRLQFSGCDYNFVEAIKTKSSFWSRLLLGNP